MAGQYLGHLMSMQLIVMLAPSVLDFLKPFSDLDIGYINNSNFPLIKHQAYEFETIPEGLLMGLAF